MFRLSTKSDYGLILLSNLASRAKAKTRNLPRRSIANSGSLQGQLSNYLSIACIAKKNQHSAKFLSQVAQELKRAGIITAKEGVSGGYTLAKRADDIKILDVLKTLDGELVRGECFDDDHECHCGGKDIWMEMKAQMEQTIGKKTVADLVV